MNNFWKSVIWQQFGAAIEMLENALEACPDELWSDGLKPPEFLNGGPVGFWYTVYHTLFFLDFYLSGRPEGFAPPAPFTKDELDPAGRLPERVYSKDELQRYLEHGRAKCRSVIESMPEEVAQTRCGFEWLEISEAELLLHNMRHVQHHTAQLNLLLRQHDVSPPRWVAKAKSEIRET